MVKVNKTVDASLRRREAEVEAHSQAEAQVVAQTIIDNYGTV